MVWGEGGHVCMNVHAADLVIDSVWLVWSLTTCKDVAVKNSLSLSLSMQIIQAISCSSEYM